MQRTAGVTGGRCHVQTESPPGRTLDNLKKEAKAWLQGVRASAMPRRASVWDARSRRSRGSGASRRAARARARVRLLELGGAQGPPRPRCPAAPLRPGRRGAGDGLRDRRRHRHADRLGVLRAHARLGRDAPVRAPRPWQARTAREPGRRRHHDCRRSVSGSAGAGVRDLAGARDLHHNPPTESDARRAAGRGVHARR